MIGRLATALAAFVRTWFAARVIAPRLDRVRRRHLSRRLAARTLRDLGLTARIRGERPLAHRPSLIVANHVSWVDVQAIGALVTARFVAKSETRRWPILGTIARGFDTFFLVRTSCRDAARIVRRVAAALAAGDSVVVFPEGTTTLGAELLRFYPAFFQAAIDAGVPVQPVAVRYLGPDRQRTEAAAFVGDTTFAQSLARIVGTRGLEVEVAFGSPIDSRGRTRRDLATVAHEAIGVLLGLPRRDAPGSFDPLRRAA